jgi:hypothetical protein
MVVATWHKTSWFSCPVSTLSRKHPASIISIIQILLLLNSITAFFMGMAKEATTLIEKRKLLILHNRPLPAFDGY